MCNNIPRSNGELPGEDPKWVSDSEKEELEMKSSYNLIVNIVNVESPYTNKVQVDGLDQINKLVKSIMLRNNFENFYSVFGKSSFSGNPRFSRYPHFSGHPNFSGNSDPFRTITIFFQNCISLFSGNPNAKYLFVLEASNTSQVYETVTEKDCPSLKNLDNGLLVVDSAMNDQKAIPLKLAL